MNIAVIGAGAIGSVVAAYLAKAGEDVILIAKDEQVKAIRENGLRINGVRGDEIFKINTAMRIDKPYDLTIFCVKTPDIENAYQDNQKFIDKSIILSTQNGVQADNMLSIHFEKERIVSSIIMFGATYVKPAEVTLNFEGNWIIGRPFAPNDSTIESIEDILKKAFPVVVSRDIMGMKWLKLFVNFNNCLPALIGKSMQETFSDMDFCRLSIMLLREGVNIVRRAGIPLVSLPNFPAERVSGLTEMPLDQAAGIINKTLTTLSKEPLYGSILQSIMRKRISEIDYINGEVVSLAKNIAVTAPLNRLAVDLVHQVETKNTFFEPENIKKEFSLK